MRNEIHNNSWSRSIAKYGIWYLLSSVITKGLGIILLPVYTKYLTPNDYGILQTINSISAFLPFLLSLSLDAAFGRYYHEAKRNRKDLTALFSTVYWFVFVYGVFMLVLLFLTTSYWFLDITSVQVYPYAYIAFIPVLLNQLALLGRTFLQQSLETKKSTILDILSTLINAGLSVTFLIYFNMGVMSRLIGIGCGSAFLFIFYHCYFYKIGLLKFQIHEEYIIKSLKYSIPLLPAVAGSWISSMSDRLVIAKYCTMTDVGLYSLAFQLGQVLYLFGDAITRVVSPLIMSGLISDKEKTKEKMSVSSFQVFLFMLLANMGMFIFSEEFIRIFADDAYHSAALYIPLFGFSYVIGMQQRYPVSIISYKKKTWIISIGCILMALVNLGFNLVFVPQYGYSFAVWAFVAANVFYTIWTFIWSQKYEYVNFRIKNLFKELVIFIVALLLAHLFNQRFEEYSALLILLKTLEITVYGFYIYKRIKNL